jgi:hypothetical protein
VTGKIKDFRGKLVSEVPVIATWRGMEVDSYCKTDINGNYKLAIPENVGPFALYAKYHVNGEEPQIWIGKHLDGQEHNTLNFVLRPIKDLTEEERKIIVQELGLLIDGPTAIRDRRLRAEIAELRRLLDVQRN